MRKIFKSKKSRNTFLIYLLGIWIFFGSIIRYTVDYDTGYLIAPAIIAFFLISDLSAKYFNNKKK